MIGKTIARIEEEPTSVEWGYADAGKVLIHFTDGTAMEVAGSSHEEVSQYVRPVSSEEVLQITRAAQGRREARRQNRLNREGWMALSCEERGRRVAARRKKQSKLALLTDDVIVGMMEDDMLSSIGFFDGQRTIRKRCPTCGERECPNAPVEKVGSNKRGPVFWGGSITIPTKGRDDD